MADSATPPPEPDRSSRKVSAAVQQPLVSIITPSYNQARFIEQAIQSVLSQDYPALEYIVIDGGSTDGTRAILESYGDRVRWISEPDNGQANAINKGFALARGDILAWINADDFYAPGAIRTVVAYFQAHPDVSLLYGDVIAIDEAGKVYGRRKNVRPTTREILIHEDDPIVQPGAFWRADLWRRVGELDDRLHYTMDYDFWIRAAEQHTLTYLPVALAYERLHAQAKTATGSIKRLEEIEQLVYRYGGTTLPRKFHAEAAAVYVLAGRFKQAGQYIHGSPRFWLRFMLYLLAVPTHAVPHLRLFASRLPKR